jgi:glycosyltransferase involved in cell wall biosynthesis
VNLWILNHYAVPPGLPGGTRHFELARQLVLRGHRVTILASSFEHFAARTSNEGQWPIRMEEHDGVTWIWIPTRPYLRNDWRRAAGMVDYLRGCLRQGRRAVGRGELERPDVILGSSVHLLAVLAAYRLSRRLRTRFVMEVRDLWPQTLVDLGGFAPRHPIVLALGLLERFLYRRADRIVTVLPFAGEHIGRFAPAERIVWIPNGVDLTRFPAALFETRNGGSFCVGYVGAFGKANALHVVLAAAEELERRSATVRFLLVGEGPHRERLEGLVRERGILSVRFVGAVPKDEIPGLLASMDACVAVLQDLPLYRFGISLNKLADYLAAGRPVVLAGRPANNIVSESGAGITVAPEDPRALADAIEQLMAMDPATRRQLGERGRAFVAAHRDWRSLAVRYEEVLRGS